MVDGMKPCVSVLIRVCFQMMGRRAVQSVFCSLSICSMHRVSRAVWLTHGAAALSTPWESGMPWKRNQAVLLNCK